MGHVATVCPCPCSCSPVSFGLRPLAEQSSSVMCVCGAFLLTHWVAARMTNAPSSKTAVNVAPNKASTHCRLSACYSTTRCVCTLICGLGHPLAACHHPGPEERDAGEGCRGVKTVSFIGDSRRGKDFLLIKKRPFPPGHLRHGGCLDPPLPWLDSRL